VSKFRSPEAEKMWQAFRELWRYVNPQSLTFDRMDKPLLAGEVWVAWDHTARLMEAFEQRPDDYVAFPAPSGPKGRGFMVVLAGLGLPKDSPHAAAVDLIEYLTRPEVQITTLESVGFFPVVQTGTVGKLPSGPRQIEDAVSKQASSRDAVPSLLPVGIGAKGEEFNLAYKAAFSRIVLRGSDIRPVLEIQAEKLRQIMSETCAKCWPPDKPSEGPCPVE
jgi:multiple sugar transport system substrate-binding protein